MLCHTAPDAFPHSLDVLMVSPHLWQHNKQVVLRDGRHLVGVMRSYDQFSNIVLEDTHERHFVGSE